MDNFVQLLHTVTMGLTQGSSEDGAGASTSQKTLVFMLAITGFIFLSSKILNFIRLLFSLFILPGKPVNQFPPAPFSPNSIHFFNGLPLNQIPNFADSL